MPEFDKNDKKHLVSLQGTPYITVVGLQAKMYDQGKSVVESDTEIIQLPNTNEDREAVVKVKVFVEFNGKKYGPICAVGDASIKNVGPKLQNATLRMAETRGWGRVYRVITRAPYTSLEELPHEQNTNERVA